MHWALLSYSLVYNRTVVDPHTERHIACTRRLVGIKPEGTGNHS
jgi:hypothetical protein